MLEQIKIKNFTVFSDSVLDFSPALNIFIGENGGGKSHILKLIYTIISVGVEGAKSNINEQPNKTNLQKAYADKLVGVFKPESLGRLVSRKQGRALCEITSKFLNSDLNTSFTFSTGSKTEVKMGSFLPKQWQDISPVFLPTREMLSLYPNFITVYGERYLEFDETYRDICYLLGDIALRGRAKNEKISYLIKVIEQEIGGEVIVENGRFYLRTKGLGKIEMHLVAEGLRKLAMLARLIATGALTQQGYLLWDEPEANLNPKLIKMLAKIILSLAQEGIQVFIASHSLFLLRELEILQNTEEIFRNMSIKYFSLAEADDGAVIVEQGNSSNDLNTIVILDESISQSNRYVDIDYVE